MRVGRQHPIANWLRCDANLYNSAMDQVLRLRDEDLKNGDHSSGLPSGAEKWFMEEQLPKLLHQPLYRKQLEEHIAELKEQSDKMNEDLQKYVQSEIRRNAQGGCLMNKGIHKDFLICADAMLACFNSIEENKAWNLMPEFLPELAKCIVMMNRELNIHLIEAECE